MSAPALRCWLFAALALGCVLGAAPVLHALNREREALHLGGYADIRGVPPELALSATALGPFRAVVIDLLWMRAVELQDDGKFFELVQLYDWISKLEPRFPAVWEYMAWNFAYNISVKFPVTRSGEPEPSHDPKQPDPRELRWQWVNRGIEALRDKGIPYNPKALSLYRELAWIYDHKIGQTADDAHFYYKVMLALEMQLALGEPPYLARLEAIVAAPASKLDLLADKAVAALVGGLREAGLDPFAKPLDTANRSPDLPPAARALLDAPAHAPAVATLDAFLRAEHLRGTLRLEPERMLALTKRFGPIDWRLPDALALYWATRSVEIAGADVERAVNADRIQFHALANFYRRGRLVFRVPKEGEPLVWVTSPNFAFIERVVKLYEDAAERWKGSQEETPTREGFLNFLREIIVDLYLHNQPRRAAHYHAYLKRIGPEDKQQSLESFVAGREAELMQTMNIEQVRNHLQGYYLQALWWASLDDLDQASGWERYAQLLLQRYSDERYTLTQPNPRDLKRSAMRQALRIFQDFQVARLRELYPDAIKAAEADLEREKAPPAEPPKKRGT